MLADITACAVVGDQREVQQGLAAFAAETAADELMITAHIFDHGARVRSLELCASAMRALRA